MLSITELLCNSANYSKPSTKSIKYIVIHSVGAVSSAKNNATYYHNNKLEASCHYFVDDTSIYRSVPDKCTAWHCGTAGGAYKQKHAEACNSNSIGIEMCQDTKTTVTAKTIANTADLVQYLMKKYDVPASHVIRHYDVVNKTCPIMYSGTTTKDASWTKLRAKLVGTAITSVPTTVKSTSSIADIKWLQNKLNKNITAKGYTDIAEDGKWGAKTDKALVKYWKQLDWTVADPDEKTGYHTAGKKTCEALKNNRQA